MYWRGKEEKKCTLCKKDTGPLEHRIFICKKLNRATRKKQEKMVGYSEEVTKLYRHLEKKRKEAQRTANNKELL